MEYDTIVEAKKAGRFQGSTPGLDSINDMEFSVNPKQKKDSD